MQTEIRLATGARMQIDLDIQIIDPCTETSAAYDRVQKVNVTAHMWIWYSVHALVDAEKKRIKETARAVPGSLVYELVFVCERDLT